MSFSDYVDELTVASSLHEASRNSSEGGNFAKRGDGPCGRRVCDGSKNYAGKG